MGRKMQFMDGHEVGPGGNPLAVVFKTMGEEGGSPFFCLWGFKYKKAA